MAYVYGAAVDTYATQALDIIRTLNDDLTTDDLASGNYVRNYILENSATPANAQAKVSALPPDLATLKGPDLHKAFLGTKASQRLEDLKKIGLKEATPGRDVRRIKQVEDSHLGEHMLNDEILQALVPRVSQNTGLPLGQPLPEEVLEAVAPSKWLGREGRQIENMRLQKAAEKNIWLADFADDAVLGLAKALWEKWGATKDYDAMWQFLRDRIFQAVMEHEIGHTIGLRHNFSGSYDSLNYNNRYWDLRSENLTLRDPINDEMAMGDMFEQGALTLTQSQGRIREFEYSSIMDYGNKFNSDIRGLGKYDHAAVLFGYTKHVEVFKNTRDTLAAELVLKLRYGDCTSRSESLPNPIFTPLLETWHYTSVWNMFRPTLGGGSDERASTNANIATREFQPWADVLKSQRDSTANCRAFQEDNPGEDAIGFLTASLGDPANPEAQRPVEVPYMFCSDDYVGVRVSCQRWDRGADPFEIVDTTIRDYRNYYFFNNFKRDRFGFDTFSVYNRVAGRYFPRFPDVYQKYLFEVLIYNSVLDPTMASYWERGMTAGFNELFSVVSTPEYGSYCQSGEELCDGQGDTFTRFTSAYEGVNVEGAISVPPGFGRTRFSRYNINSGYYARDQVSEAGHFWEYLAAMEALTTTTGVFAGVDQNADFQTYSVPYFLLFSDQLTSLFEGVVAEDYTVYAPGFKKPGWLGCPRFGSKPKTLRCLSIPGTVLFTTPTASKRVCRWT